MENVIFIILAVLLCGGAIYRWVKYVESIADASVTLKGAQLKKTLSKRTTTDG